MEEVNVAAELNIAEIPYETGEIRFRYARVMAADGTRWIRHGSFCECARNGQVISEGTYSNGRENGLWRDYYENGQLAAEGTYVDGQEAGDWRYWDREGNPTDAHMQQDG